MAHTTMSSGFILSYSMDVGVLAIVHSVNYGATDPERRRRALSMTVIKSIHFSGGAFPGLPGADCWRADGCPDLRHQAWPVMLAPWGRHASLGLSPGISREQPDL